jgi:transposase
MSGRQGQVLVKPPFQLEVERLGPLPILNHFLEKLGLTEILDRHIPTRDRRCALPYARALGVLLRSIVVEREPIYRHQEVVEGFHAPCFGLSGPQAWRLRDDQIGRALDRLFEADRGSLLTEVVVATSKRFEVRLDELHNDSTTVRFQGQYRGASGRSLRGKKAPWITYGHSKDHRPDLKQLLFVLTTSDDGGVPVQFRCEDGNTNDSTTHLETWEALRVAAGRADFLYVADSKLCATETMDRLDRCGGRFVTVMPRARREDQEFRRWIQTHQPEWELTWDRPHPRRKGGPRDRWSVFRHPLPSREGWPVVWVWSTLLALHTERRRRERLAAAVEALEEEDRKLRGPRPRRRSRATIQEKVEQILRHHRVQRYLRVESWQEELERYRQEHRGRPGPRTRYRREARKRWRLRWQVDQDTIAYDRKSDGMYPLLTNDPSLSSRQVLEAHKRQPVIEKRFEQAKTVHEIAPVFLKNEGRIEALFFTYFLALLLQALIERELRGAMARRGLEVLPLYPEQRACRRPTAQQVLRLFALTTRHKLKKGARVVQVFEPEFTAIQRQVLELLGVPGSTFTDS